HLPHPGLAAPVLRPTGRGSTDLVAEPERIAQFAHRHLDGGIPAHDLGGVGILGTESTTQLTQQLRQLGRGTGGGRCRPGQFTGVTVGGCSAAGQQQEGYYTGQHASPGASAQHPRLPPRNCVPASTSPVFDLRPCCSRVLRQLPHQGTPSAPPGGPLESRTTNVGLTWT